MEFIEKKSSCLDNICIILTSTIYVNPKKNHLCNTDPNNRLEIYLKSIKQWLEKTNFKIVLVENSGYKYPELKKYAEIYKDRFEMILFKENEIEEEVYVHKQCGYQMIIYIPVKEPVKCLRFIMLIKSHSWQSRVIFLSKLLVDILFRS